MNKLIVLFAAMILWSTTSFANLTLNDANSDLNTISQWTRHLNNNYSTLDLKANTSNPKKYGQVLSELDQLERHLHGEAHLADRSLVMLACVKTVCAGIVKSEQ